MAIIHRFFRNTHYWSNLLKFLIVMIAFNVLILPAVLAVLIVSLIPMSGMVKVVLTSVSYVLGVTFAGYGTYKVYKMIPSSTWNKIDESMYAMSNRK